VVAAVELDESEIRRGAGLIPTAPLLAGEGRAAQQLVLGLGEPAEVEE
jgi:hypothetical protein